MRINRFLATALGISRRQADEIVSKGLVLINETVARPHSVVGSSDKVILGKRLVKLPTKLNLVLFNKPVGYVCSRAGQGSKTIYSILPPNFKKLKPVGRLDKDSCGLILLTNDGSLANLLLHPKHQKIKVYLVELDKPVAANDISKLKSGVVLSDGPSHFSYVKKKAGNRLEIGITEGRNRQVRRTMLAVGYRVKGLERLQFGPYRLGDLAVGRYKELRLDSTNLLE